MNYSFFLDEQYPRRPGSPITVACWACEHEKLNEGLLRELRNRPSTERIDNAFEALRARAIVARVVPDPTLYRSGETDGCDDVLRMARNDNFWGITVSLTVTKLILELADSVHSVGETDLFYDPKGLTAHHRTALERVLRTQVVSEVVAACSEVGLGQRISRFRMNKIEQVFKSNHGPATQSELGTWVADQLCARSGEITRKAGTHRITVCDLSGPVNRTAQQFDGKPF